MKYYFLNLLRQLVSPIVIIGGALKRLTATEIICYAMILFLVGAAYIKYGPQPRKVERVVQKPTAQMIARSNDDELDKLRNCKAAVDCNKIADDLKARGLIK